MHSSWHLIGYCRLRNDYRDFGADRIKNLHLTDQQFDKSKRMSLQRYITEEFKAEHEQPVLIKARFSYDVVRYLREQKYYFGVVHEKNEEQYVEMHFMYQQLEYFARWLLMLGNGAVVLEPRKPEETSRANRSNCSANITAADIRLSQPRCSFA